MKFREYIILPLLSIAVGTVAFCLCALVQEPRLLNCPDYLLFSLGDRWFMLTILSLFYIGIPGMWVADRFRNYPERVRLSPISFGLIAVIPAALIPCFSYPVPFYIGNAVMAVTVLSMARFKPGARLGIFKPIPFKATLSPFVAAIAPLVITLFFRCKHI